jgi:hypothetical protein
MTTYDGLVNDDIELIKPVSYLPGDTATGSAFATVLRGSYTLARRSKRVLGQTNYSVDMTNLPKSFQYHKLAGSSSWKDVYVMRSFLPKDANAVLTMVSWKSIGPADITHRVQVTDGSTTVSSSEVTQAAVENSVAWSAANIVTKAGRYFEGGTGAVSGDALYRQKQNLTNYNANVPSFTACDPQETSWVSLYTDAATLVSGGMVWIIVSMKAVTGGVGGADASMIPLSCTCWYDIA